MSYFLAMKNAIVLFFLLGWTTWGFTQPTNFALDELKKMYEKGEYYNAYVLASELLQRDSSLANVWFIKGKSAAELFLYDRAHEAFQHIISLGKEKDYPDFFFDLAEVSRSLGKYDEALAYYHFYQFLDVPQKTKEKLKKAAYYVEFKDSLLHLVQSYDSTFEVSHLPMPVNSPYSEFAHLERNDTLFFTSIRPLYDKDPEHLLENEFFSSLYVVRFGAFGYKKPEKLPYPFADKNKHVANLVFKWDGTEAWFNLCEQLAEAKFRCDAYAIKKMSTGKWSRPAYVPFNLPGYSTTQLAYARDSLGNEILFFASDRPGGYGGMDLWYVVKKGDKYGQPINLGSFINSPGNELTPFYDSANKTLYFSSDYWIGLGGYDVFYAKGFYNKWEKPHNLRRPINSPAHDVYFFLAGDYGYLTSNRKGSFALKGETCCYDIYAFNIIPKQKKEDSLAHLPSSEPPHDDLKTRITSLLPINLYFHNDYPDPKSRDSTTRSTYQENYELYISLQDKFIREYSRGLEGSAKEKATKDMEDFFTTEVTGNYQKLLEFLPLMLEDLKNGSKVVLTIQGFTSPLTTTEYNLNLAKRRIKSIIQFLKQYQNGVFVPYMQGDTPALRIIEKPVGEVLADKTVSDNPHDQRNSIYSIKASRERRVQIASYQSTFNKVPVVQHIPIARFSTHDVMITSLHDSCKEITITNEGTGTLEIKRIFASHPWVKFNHDKTQIPPKESANLRLCVDFDQLKKSKLALLYLETNEPISNIEVIYLRYDK